MSCSVKQAFKMINENINNSSVKIVDVRSQSEFLGGHIKNAALIPLGEISQRLN